MLENDTLGVHCVKDDKFYYMEAGNMNLRNPLPRIIKVLQIRDLITVIPDTERQPQQYYVMKAADAKVNSFEIVPIYLNKHIKELVESDQATKKKPAGRWGKSD